MHFIMHITKNKNLCQLCCCKLGIFKTCRLYNVPINNMPSQQCFNKMEGQFCRPLKSKQQFGVKLHEDMYIKSNPGINEVM